MGKWDFQGIEILDGENAIDTMRALLKAQGEVDEMTIDHQFRGYHIFRHKGKQYLHIGWNSCNALAYKVLKHLGRDRDIISSYSGVGFDHKTVKPPPTPPRGGKEVGGELTYEQTLTPELIFSIDADPDFDSPITFLTLEGGKETCATL